MPDQQRSPPQMPAGATTLSERIAALQRKASDSQHRPGSPSMARTPSGGASSSSLSPPLPPWTTASSNKGSQQPQAVRDRIARFQQSAVDLGERPLLPRSSFGAGAPNPDNSGRVLRPYPGASAAGGGSGNWGENVLRPQMTGSAWLGTGQGPRSPGLVPQMTGPTWSRRQASTPESLTIPPSNRHISGRDAFQDLDQGRATSPNSPRSLGSHASDVATQAAALKGITLAPPARRQPIRTPSQSSTDPALASDGLPSFPETPQDGIIAGKSEVLTDESESHLGTVQLDGSEKDIPSPPKNIPRSPRIGGPSNAAADTSIEVGVAGPGAAELSDLQRRVENSESAVEVASTDDADVSIVDLGAAPSPPPEDLLSRQTSNGDRSFRSNGSAPITVEANATSTSLKSLHAAGVIPPIPKQRFVDPSGAVTQPQSASSHGGTSDDHPSGGSTDTSSSSPVNGAAKLSTPPKKTPSTARKNNSIRRPPPGRIMSIAELDASDDEYEPGWASVISSSRS